MISIYFAQDSLSIWKDILVPLFSAFIGAGAVVWIGYKTLKKQDAHTEKQVKIQAAVALLEERIKFKEKILGKIDEISKIFSNFGYPCSITNIDGIMNHEVIQNRLRRNDKNIDDLIYWHKYKDCTPQFVLGDYMYLYFRNNNQSILHAIKNEIEYQIYSLEKVYSNSNVLFSALKKMIEEGVKYMEIIFHIIAKTKDISQEEINLVKTYYEKNLERKHWNSTPAIIEEIQEIRNKIEENFIKEIKLEI